MDEINKLREEIAQIEEDLKPKKERLAALYRETEEAVEGRLRLAHAGKEFFKPDELVFAATSRCPCGAGLAHPKNTGPHGYWDCSAILLGTAAPVGSPEAKRHTAQLPFTFYEIKSENQPSANGSTTRPK